MNHSKKKQIAIWTSCFFILPSAIYTIMFNQARPIDDIVTVLNCCGALASAVALFYSIKARRSEKKSGVDKYNG